MLAIHPFEATISVVGVIVGAVVVLTLFFKCVSWLSGRSQKVKALTFGGVLDDRTCVTIHISNGAKIEQARVLGFIHERNDGVPYHLRGMLVVEHGDARRTLIRADVIRFIEARPPGSAIT